MSRKEKQEAGERLIELTDWSNVEIGRRLACADTTVMRWREKIDSANAEEQKVKESTTEIPGLVGLLCGDFAEIAKKLNPQSIDVIITDPPYGREFVPLYGMWQFRNCLKPTGNVRKCPISGDYAENHKVSPNVPF